MIKRSPGLTPKPRFGPNLDSTAQGSARWNESAFKPLQDIRLVLSLSIRINTIIRKHPPCLGTPPPPSSPTLLRNIVFSLDNPLLQYMNACRSIFVVAISCKQINRSHTHTPTENNTPDNDTHTGTRREQHPKRTHPTST